jgi:sulfotransferase family protein/glycosyl transferase family 7 (putative galactosyltransferase)
MNDLSVAFCITCKGRTQHLERTLPKNLADNHGLSKFVVLDYNSKDNLNAYLTSKYPDLIESGKLAVYRFGGVGPFKMAHAKNMTHRLGIREGADVLVNLDADNYTGLGFDQYVIDRFQQFGNNILLWARWNKPGADPKAHIPKGCSGRIVVTKQAFLKAGGYDEKYDTWGPDDKDFHYRLRLMGYSPHEIDRQYLNAILHTDKMRFREYPHAKAMIGVYHPIHSDSTTALYPAIANAGDVGRGVVFKATEKNPIELTHIPSRIFGIGMHKTATTSLHAAFKILGLDSAHWKSVAWAKRCWDEMNEWGKSSTLEKYYCLSDLPFTLLYPELDVAYPGSKFVLTVRSEENWIESVRRHWSRENAFRDTWNKEAGFSRAIHAAVYGQFEFNREIFLSRYRQHNAEVKEYFKNRPDDLLVMDMDEGKAGWLELCGFLRLPLPSVPYPIEFVTGDSFENQSGGSGI